MSPLLQISLAFFLALLIALIAYQARSLSRSGAFGTILVGTVIFGLGGWQWAILLLAFFITSTLLTRTFKNQKDGLTEKYSKGGQRDIGQVFGNGGLATLFAGLHFFLPQANWVWIAFAASLAAVNADTWATELGVLNPSEPRLITQPRKIVEKGTSGGVSLVGTLATLAGAGLIGLLAGWFSPHDGCFWITLFTVTSGGFAGSLFDSYLGATVQAIYHCPFCEKETERYPKHTCGTETIQIRGWIWLDNDWVNFACGTVGMLVALVIFSLS
ncbi:MAG: DUF92 domain-containing protein [Anaerolineales bacterium]|nr:DUF92 domain-containing protein [Anaerolineales bacterium]